MRLSVFQLASHASPSTHITRARACINQYNSRLIVASHPNPFRTRARHPPQRPPTAPHRDTRRTQRVHSRITMSAMTTEEILDYDAAVNSGKLKSGHITKAKLEKAKRKALRAAKYGERNGELELLVERHTDSSVTVRDIDTDCGTFHLSMDGPITKDRPVIVTVHDVGLNHISCFQRFFNLARTDSSSIFHKFTVVHVDLPGQQCGAPDLDSSKSNMDFVALRGALDVVLRRVGITTFVGFGVGAGGYLLLDYASTHAQQTDVVVEGLWLLGVTSRRVGWVEWGWKLASRMAWTATRFDKWWRDYFFLRFFSAGTVYHSTDLMEFHQSQFDSMNQRNVYALMQGFQARRDITAEVGRLGVPIMLVVGDATPLEVESLHVMAALQGNHRVEWIRIRNAGMLATEEYPVKLIQPFTLFLNGLGYHNVK